nr:calcium-activated chloride channel regulator 1-like [Procambarus clarkii]
MHHVSRSPKELTTPTMGLRAWVVVWAAVAVVGGVEARGGVRVEEGGAYRDLTLAIHPAFIPNNCTAFFSNLQATLGVFSQRLWTATIGRVYIGAEVDVVVPAGVARACSIQLSAHATWQRWSNADIRLQPGGGEAAAAAVGAGAGWEWGPEGSMGVGVAQPEGCGRGGQYITLDADLLQDLQHDDLHTLGGSLVGGWARYRWGVFEERGYDAHPRYPSAHIKEGSVTPTACTPTPTPGRWTPRIGSGECEEGADDGVTGCVWLPDDTHHLNTSLLYRSDLPQMWGFCDYGSHDEDAPTPHNLLCEAASVWEVILQHPDMRQPPPHTTPHSTSPPHHPHTLSPTQHTLHTQATAGDAPTPLQRFPTEERRSSAEASTLTLDVTGTEEALSSANTSAINDTLFLSDVRRRLSDRNDIVGKSSAASTTVQHANTAHLEGGNSARRRRASSQDMRRGVVPLRPSLVTAHMATSTPHPPSPAHRHHGTNLTTAGHLTPSHLHHHTAQHPRLVLMGGGDDVGVSVEDSASSSTPAWSGGPPAGHTTPPSPHWPPADPTLVLLAPAPSVVVLALDLSDPAVAQVKMDVLRGGILRWLWGLGPHVRVGVLAAYNNASYPLTLGPLFPGPTTAAHLEDELALLPSTDEVQHGVYGGEYCLSCVLHEATKMMEGGGVGDGGGVLLVAACTPAVTPAHIAQALHSNISVIHTLALCHSTDFLFDQLAGPGGLSWVLPGPAAEDGDGAEQRAGKVLTAATRATLAAPGDPTLVRVGGVVAEVAAGGVVNGGPYSSVSGRVTLPSAGDLLLLLITTHFHAKIVELTGPSGEEIDLIRDTNQRFWAILDKNGGEYIYNLKFLTSSIEFPFSVTVDVYERKQNSVGIEVRLYTNNDGHVPLEPGSKPLVVWAEVTLDGRPVVGSKVMLKVSHLSESGSTDLMVELLDNGNAEPDVRAQDGVYTRYLTWLPGEGRYALSATATDHHGAASVLRPRRRDGRVVPVSAGQFTVTSSALTVTVARVTSADITPPSRVTDLTVTSVGDTTVNLTWSAPGGDLDQGSAWVYELKMYSERGALSEERFNTSTIAVYCISEDLQAPAQTPASYGTAQHCLTHLPFTNLRWYFAIRAVDSSNNTGRISNIVSAFVPDPPTTPPPTSHPASSVQTVIMSTITAGSPHHPHTHSNATSRDHSKSASYGWRVWVAVGVGVGGIILALGMVLACVCCCRTNPTIGEKDPDRPVYKIYVNNAYIQEEDREIKVVSNGKLVDDNEPSQVQEWVNSLSKFGSPDVYGGEPGEAPAASTDAPLVECRPRASVKYSSPVRFGVLTNGSIMREACPSSSSTSSSKPSDDPGNEDLKYRDLSETTSNSTTDGGASAASTATTDTVPPPPPVLETARAVPVNIKATESDLPLPPPPSQLMQQHLGIPGPTVISIHSGRALNSGYSSDEEGGFRPRTLPGPGPRRYLPTHFSSFRYLPPPPEYRSALGNAAPLDYPTCHTISRATATLPHGTVRSVKKRRHISFV